MRDYSDRARVACELRMSGANCAQAVVCSFADRIGLPEETLMAAAGGFGGGVGGSHEEMCGALSGGVLALSLLFPYAEGGDAAARKKVYGLSKRFRQRFLETFGHTRCSSLLELRPGVSEKTAAAARLGIGGHCDIMIVTAVELVEGLLAEEQ